MINIEQKLHKLIVNSPTQKIKHPLLIKKRIQLTIKRDDLLHPAISGNKWRKLKYNLIEAERLGKKQLLSFGGAFSNHIHALAAAGHYLELATVGIIRGEKHFANNPTLSQAQQWGMQLQFIDRKTYRLKEQTKYLQQLARQYPHAYIIPEGGTNNFAIEGVVEIVNELLQQIHDPIDHIVTATGSAGTMSGLMSGVYKHAVDAKVHGIAVLKEADYLQEKIKGLCSAQQQVNWKLHTEFHQGGYGKISKGLKKFCQEFTQVTQIPIEPIYTGKMFYALWQLIEQDYFPCNSHIVAVHTGGLQGLAGLREQNKF